MKVKTLIFFGKSFLEMIKSNWTYILWNYESVFLNYDSEKIKLYQFHKLYFVISYPRRTCG